MHRLLVSHVRILIRNLRSVFTVARRFQSQFYRSMNNSILVQKFNPGTGKLEWELQEENYDYHQELARAGFADMLHDEERNLKYNLALQKAIESFKARGEDARVLDIGTGTGLLALMAAKSQASEVTACETFQPMASCAKDVIRHNGCIDKIHLIPKRSTDIIVGPTGDMKNKANILVTEVFDTELIGEGAIGTFNHANKELLTEDSIVIPARASIFVQLVECPLTESWNRSKPIQFRDQVIYPPHGVSTCPGNGAVHDIQMAQLDPSQFKALTDPVSIFDFDWNSKTPIPNDDYKTISLKSKACGTVQAVLLWWTLDMDREGEIVLSCAPPWAHPEGDKLPWRDHWMQAVYYLPKDVSINSEGAELHLTGYHDEYSLWFGLSLGDPVFVPEPRPFCQCSVHMAVSRTRLGQLNDKVRNAKYLEALEKLVRPETVCMTLGDSCLLGLMVAKLGARKVYAVERNPHCRRVLEAWAERNQLKDRIVVMDGRFDDKEPFEDKVNFLLAEPVFESSVLPWHNLYFAQWKRDLEPLLADGVTVMPGKAHIYAMAVELKDLWKIRAPVGSTQGVDLLHFDKLIQGAIEASDDPLEPHPLWEYPCRALSDPVRLMTLDLTSLQPQNVQGKLDISSGTLNGIVLWVDWQLDQDVSVSTGPVTPPMVGSNVQWDRHCKQAVYFIQDSLTTTALHYQAGFVPDDLKFHFSTQ